jgi:hypothetical protein
VIATKPASLAWVRAFDGVRRQLRATSRLVPWWPLLIVIAASSLLVRRAGLAGDAAELALGAGAAVGLSPLFGDAATTTLAPSPTSRRLRALARITVAVPVAAACWLIARTAAFQSLPDAPPLLQPSSWLPSKEAWMVVLTLCTLALAIEFVAVARRAVAGMVGAMLSLLLAVVLPFLPERIAYLPVADHPTRWLLTAAAAVTLFTMATVDPGRARRTENR